MIRRSTTSQAHSIVAAKSSTAWAQAITALHKFLKTIEPTVLPDTLLAEDTKFGIVDKLLFEKAKPDKNGIYSNVKLIKKSFDIHGLIKEVQHNPIPKSDVVIAYKPINDKYHYILLRKMNITKENVEKYLLLI